MAEQPQDMACTTGIPKEPEISVQGRMVTQTVIYSSVDYLGEKWYYTQEGHRYIMGSRRERAQQQFVEGYLDKIPIIVRQPVAVGKDAGQDENYLSFGEVSVAEHGRKKELFAVVMKKTNANVVWNLYWLEGHKIPHRVEILYRTKAARKYLRR